MGKCFDQHLSLQTLSFSDVFRDFFAQHAEVFKDAPAEISGEQNLAYYALFEEYLRLYELEMSEYIRSLDVSVEEFFSQLVAVKNDPEIKDRKLLHFVNYLLASTDYAAFYKVMARAAKKANAENRAESKSEGKSSLGESKGDSKAESKSHK